MAGEYDDFGSPNVLNLTQTTGNLAFISGLTHNPTKWWYLSLSILTVDGIGNFAVVGSGSSSSITAVVPISTFTRGVEYTWHFSGQITYPSDPTVYTSDTYTFSLATTPEPPDKATIGVPPDGYTHTSLSQPYLTWDVGDGTSESDVFLDGVKVASDLPNSDEKFELDDYIPMEYGESHTWRVDCKNEEGTTTGDTWSFTTVNYDPPIPSYELIPGGNGKGPIDPDGPGTEWVDWRWTGTNGTVSISRLCGTAANGFWFEDKG